MLLFLLLMKLLCLILGTILLVFCGLFGPCPSPLCLLRDCIAYFLALRVFGSFVMIIVLVFALSLMVLFLLFPVPLCSCIPKHEHPCPRAPCFSPHTLPPLPIHPSDHIDPNAVPQNTWHVSPVPLRCHALFLLFMTMTYMTENVPLPPPPVPPASSFVMHPHCMILLHHFAHMRTHLCPSVSFYTCPHVWMHLLTNTRTSIKVVLQVLLVLLQIITTICIRFK